MVKNKILKIIFFIFISYILFPEEEIKIDISIDKKSVEVNEVFQIDIKINGISRDITVENINNTNENITIKSVGEMQGYGYSTIDNKRFDYYILTFIAKVSKPGNYEIGPFILNIKEKKYSTDLLKITVSDSKEVTVSNQEKINPENNNNFYLLELKCNKNEVYVNEPIDIEVNFYNRLGFQNPNYKYLSFPKSAWIERIEKKEEYNNKIQKNNHIYLSHSIEKERIYISNPGIYNIEPASLDFIGLTSPNFFSVPEHIILKTSPLSIIVKPLPEKAPSNFNGAIGTLNLKVFIEPLKLKAKDSATLKIILEGDGNFQNINDIGFNIDNSFETYSSNSVIEKKADNNKVKIWETILVPFKTGKFNLKLNDFNYFDLKQEKYITIEGKEFTLNVLECDENKTTSSDTISELKVTNDKNEKIENNKVNLNDINQIKFFPGKSNNIFKYKLWFKTVIILYVAIFILISLFILNKYLIFNIIIKNNNSNKKAYKYFINHIGKLKKNINKISTQKETDIISNIIEKYFITKFHIDSVEFTNKDIDKKLSNFLSNTMLNNLKDIINKLNFIRFSGKEILKEDFINIIDFIKNLIKQIEFTKK